MNNRKLTNQYKTLNLAEVALPICIDRFEDGRLIDKEGNAYLDFSSGYCVTNTGWQNPEVTKAVKEQLNKISYSAPWFPTKEAIDLAETLHRLTNHQFAKCVRATGGAEANEIVFKASYALNKKPGVLSFHRAYHGGSRFAVNISDREAFNFPATPYSNQFHKVEPPYCYRCPLKENPESCSVQCASLVENALIENPDIGVFFLEPVIGSGGVIPMPESYVQKVKDILAAHDVIMVFDEVITGFGRIGAMTSMELFNVIPDAITFAKGMGGGTVPIGAAMLSERLAKALEPFEDVSATFAWTPIACAAANANIRVIERNQLCHRAKEKGAELLDKVKSLFNTYLPENTGEVRGKGLLIGVEFVNNQYEKVFFKRLNQRLSLTLVRSGLMICQSWDYNVLLICPPLNMPDEDLELGLQILEIELKKMAVKAVA